MKNLSLFLIAFVLTLSFSSCKKDDNNTAKDEIVKIVKQHDNALLLVTFGSTWDEPHQTYKRMLDAYKAEFPEHDVYLSFTSTLCITRWGAKTKEYYATPDKWLEAMANHGYKKIAVQSLHVIPGEEYQLVKNKYIKEFVAKHKDIPVVLGDALLTTDQDIKEVGDALIKEYKTKLDKNEAVAFMGHGNPKPEFINKNNVNASYVKIQDYMHKIYGKTIIVGTVDYEPMLIPEVLKQLKSDVPTGSVVNLVPLMSIAGDHANNDMAGDEDSKEKPEDQSWKVQITKAGYKIDNNNCILKGLGDYPAVLNVWIRHTKAILK